MKRDVRLASFGTSIFLDDQVAPIVADAGSALAIGGSSDRHASVNPLDCAAQVVWDFSYQWIRDRGLISLKRKHWSWTHQPFLR